MKPDKREEARRLRREEGLAITEICKILGVAKSSVSLWVRDIELSDEQKAELHRKHYAYRAQLKGSHTNAIKARALREQYQQEGRAKAREQDPLHIAGCMLYWGEGAKSRNSLKLANSDPDLLCFYLSFLRQTLGIEDHQVAIRIICYTNNGLTQLDIENYWLGIFNLPVTCLTKTVVNQQPRSSQQKGRKLLYGTCEIAVHSTRLVQHVLGAIQEYTGIDKPEWLM
jgi:transposase-like protein